MTNGYFRRESLYLNFILAVHYNLIYTIETKHRQQILFALLPK